MTDITEIQLKIEAVEFALRSFARFSDEPERKDHLRKHFDDVLKLDTYFGFSEDELKSEKRQLQENLNILLTQQQGKFVNMSNSLPL